MTKYEMEGEVAGTFYKAKEVEELLKENKLQEEIIIGEQQEINRLEKENKQLKQDNESLRAGYLDLTRMRNKEREEHIKELADMTKDRDEWKKRAIEVYWND